MWQLVANNGKREARDETLFFFAYANDASRSLLTIDGRSFLAKSLMEHCFD